MLAMLSTSQKYHLCQKKMNIKMINIDSWMILLLKTNIQSFFEIQKQLRWDIWREQILQCNRFLKSQSQYDLIIIYLKQSLRENWVMKIWMMKILKVYYYEDRIDQTQGNDHQWICHMVLVQEWSHLLAKFQSLTIRK